MPDNEEQDHVDTRNPTNTVSMSRKTEKESIDNNHQDDKDEYTPFISANTLFVHVIIIAVGILTIAAYAAQSASLLLFTSVTAVGVAVAGASSLIGGLVGFLFGIPRRLQRDTTLNRVESSSSVDSRIGHDNTDDDSSRSLYSGNTNLEQISDWLTKILVGVGLTQIREVSDLLMRAGEFASVGLGKFSGGQTFAVFLILYFLIDGFMLGYLWARLFLGGLFTQAERITTYRKKLSKLEEQARADANALSLIRQQLEGSLEDNPATQKKLDSAIKDASTDVRSHIFYKSESQRKRNWSNETTKLSMERTIPIFRALANSDTGNLYHRNHGQLGYALKDKRNPDWRKALDELSEAIAIRDNAGETNQFYEFNRALCQIMIDDDFKNNNVSKKQVKEKIIRDLEVAGEDEFVKQLINNDDTIYRWMHLNDFKLSS